MIYHKNSSFEQVFYTLELSTISQAIKPDRLYYPPAFHKKIPKAMNASYIIWNNSDKNLSEFTLLLFFLAPAWYLMRATYQMTSPLFDLYVVY